MFNLFIIFFIKSYRWTKIKTNLIDVVDAGNESVRPFGGDSKLRPIIDGSEPPIE